MSQASLSDHSPTTPNESIVLQRFDKYRAPYPMKRVVLRHVPEASAQRLLSRTATSTPRAT